jgi:hypothetical protein
MIFCSAVPPEFFYESRNISWNIKAVIIEATTTHNGMFFDEKLLAFRL